MSHSSLSKKMKLFSHYCKVFKLKIFSYALRSIISQRSLRDRRRASSISGSVSGRSNRQSHERLQAITENEFNNVSPSNSVKNSVQAQIEEMFKDIANDDEPPIVGRGGSSFSIKYLGALPLTTKVTSLIGLQEPLRQLYLSGAGHEVSFKKKVPKIVLKVLKFENKDKFQIYFSLI